MFANVGITLLGVVVLIFLLAIVALDMWFELRHWRPLGELISTWSSRYPLFAAGLTAVFGAMVGHFFWP